MHNNSVHLHTVSFRFLVFGLLVLFSIISSTAFSSESENLQNELRLLTTKSSASHPSDQKRLNELQQFYKARNFQSAWIQSGQLTPSFHAALAFLESAVEHGLNRDDYQPDRLHQLSLGEIPQQDFTLEFETTWHLFQFMHDLYRGRYDAKTIDPDWHIPQPDFDPSAFLLRFLDSGDLQQAFESLITPNPTYRTLQQALAKFRNLVSQQITWTKIPNTQPLKPGASHPAIVQIRQRIKEAYETHGFNEYHLTTDAPDYQHDHYDSALENAVKAFPRQPGLNDDGIIGPNTIAAMNRTPAEKLQQLRINLERLRWLPKNLSHRYLLVNIAGFQLTAIENNQHLFDMRIIVGRNYRSTPSFQSRITHMILNPYWNVPASIARKDLLPKQQRNPNFFVDQNIKVYRDYTYRTEPIDPDTIDWNTIKNGFPYALRQEPGAQNALGSIKFMLPNPYSIYLHDTPSKSLFNKDIRTFSSGCIRLEKPLLLAGFALQDAMPPDELRAEIDTGITKQINLTESLPVYMLYLTTWVDSQHQVHYSPDTYERDKRALNLIN